MSDEGFNDENNKHDLIANKKFIIWVLSLPYHVNIKVEGKKRKKTEKN